MKWLKSSKGATLIEYVLIASLLGVALCGSYKLMGSKYLDMYHHIDNGLATGSNAN